MGIGWVGLVGEPDVGMQMEVDEHALGGSEERGCRLAQRAGQHTCGVRDVGTRLCRGVE